MWEDQALYAAFKASFDGGEQASQHSHAPNPVHVLILRLFAVPNFEMLSQGITDPVNRTFFKNFCERCSKLTTASTASNAPPFIMNVVMPKLRQDQVILRAAALRWPSFASQETRQHRMRQICPGGIAVERENCKKMLLEMSPRCFSPACQLILDRIWDKSVSLEVVDVLKGISSIEPADEALAREIIESARSLQVEADLAPGPEGAADSSTHELDSKRGSFGGCGRSCREHHFDMACDVCGVDYGYHLGK
jgi:hypothetical protein